jgi:hypothetical protein
MAAAKSSAKVAEHFATAQSTAAEAIMASRK